MKTSNQIICPLAFWQAFGTLASFEIHNSTFYIVCLEACLKTDKQEYIGKKRHEFEISSIQLIHAHFQLL